MHMVWGNHLSRLKSLGSVIFKADRSFKKMQMHRSLLLDNSMFVWPPSVDQIVSVKKKYALPSKLIC